MKEFSAILIRHCCHSNRRNTLSIDSTQCLESYSMHNFSFILFRNIHRQFLRLKFAFFHFSLFTFHFSRNRLILHVIRCKIQRNGNSKCSWSSPLTKGELQSSGSHMENVQLSSNSYIKLNS